MRRSKKNTSFTAIALIAMAAFSILPIQAKAQASPPPPPGAAAYSQSNVVQGTVARYLMNPDGEVDGLLLGDGTQVNFPPHMSNDLVTVVKPNDSVSIQGFRSYGAAVVKADVITNTRSGQSVVDHPPAWSRIPPSPWSRKEMSAEGRIQALLYGPAGDVHGVLLQDGTEVIIPPPAQYQLPADLLKVDQPINAVGYGTQNQFGRSMEATGIGAPGQAMTSLFAPGAPGGLPLPPR